MLSSDNSLGLPSSATLWRLSPYYYYLLPYLPVQRNLNIISTAGIHLSGGDKNLYGIFLAPKHHPDAPTNLTDTFRCGQLSTPAVSSNLSIGIFPNEYYRLIARF